MVFPSLSRWVKTSSKPCFSNELVTLGEARTMDFEEGDVGYVQQSTPHYIENTGTTDVVFFEVFPTSYFEDVSLAEWLAHTPSRLVNEHIRTGEDFIRNISKVEAVIRPE